MEARSALIHGLLRPPLIAEKAEAASTGGSAVRNLARDPQFHFRTRSSFAPHFESRADLLGTLAHTRQTPMSIATRVQQLRVDTFSIVPDKQPKQPIAVGDLHFDSLCLSMLERISQRLARDAVNVIAQDRVQLSRRSLDSNVETW